MDAPTPDDRLAPPPTPYSQEVAAPLAPVKESERLEVLDALRGLCILGILAVNIFGYALPGLAFMARGTWGEATMADEVAHGAMLGLFAQKFYPILSLLFGVGMWMQLSKGREGASRLPQYLWRNFLLLLLGAVHGILFFYGDVLFVYACCAALACLAWKLPAMWKLVVGTSLAAIVSLCCMPALYGMLFLGASFGGAGATTSGLEFPLDLAAAREFAGDRALRDNLETLLLEQGQPSAEAVIAHYYAHGTFLEATAVRVAGWATVLVSSIFSFGFQVVGLMILGMWTAEIGLWREPAARRKALLVVAGIGWVIALPASVVGAGLASVEHNFQGLMILAPAASFQAAAYVCTFLLLWEARWFRALCTGFKAVGRTALTNYLGQSVVFTTLFMGYGFGLFGKLMPAQLVALAAAAWVAQMAMSWLWLRAFQMGPVEWVWRSAAYGKVQRLRREGA